MIANGKAISYTYTASGEKLQGNFGAGKKYDYIGGLVFANDTLEYISTAEGRWTKANKFEYYLKDHLGNLRVSCGCEKGILKALQETHYEPFGVELSGLGQSGKTRDKFTGKETQELTGLIDFGARQYDNLVPHWTSTDPLSELDMHQSPYMYVSGNPISRIDLFGCTDCYGYDTKDDSKCLDQAVVKAEKLPQYREPSTNSFMDNMQVAYARNEERYGHYSPYQEHFRSGSNIAGGIFGAVAGVGVAAQMGAGAVISQGVSYLSRANMLSAGRWMLRNTLSMEYTKKALLAKASINILGKMTENGFKNEMKIDFVGLAADMGLTNGMSAVVGGVGEMGYDFKEKDFYREGNPIGSGIVKFATGFGLGWVSDKLGAVSAANGFSSAMTGMGQSIIKIYEEAINGAADKINQNEIKRK